MFIRVNCPQCAKPFQVPEQTVGRPTVCPWCQTTVAALPVGSPAVPSTAAEPLPRVDQLPRPSPLPRRIRSRLARIALIALMTVAVTVVTFSFLRYKKGHFLHSEWQEFVAPDGSCRADLLGQPVEESNTDQKWFISEGWYSGTKTWVGWRDLNPIQVELAASKDGWVALLPLFAAEHDRLKARYGGVVIKEATRPDAPLTHEVRLHSPDGQVIERMILMTEGTKPRLYYVGLAGKRLDFDGDIVKRLFDSFRVLE